MTIPAPDEILGEQISKEAARLAELEGELEQTRARLQELRRRATSCAPASELAPRLLPQKLSAKQKVALFRSLFRGRDDVYPRLWENLQRGKKGYAPACSNEWVHGVCEKPRVKCGECPNQALIPVGDQVIEDHLRGRHVIGVYPLLKDETCWLLAVDFDKSKWRNDVAAFRDTARAAGLAPAVERSRSGNGAHVWFFFSAPVSAATARKMGCFLITETMVRRHELSMESYDRLFPNQDTMPKGGFGNLIALPLQLQARRARNTEFLDDTLEPIPDPWAYLASLPRISPSLVESIAQEASTRGKVLGVRFVDDADEEEARIPWSKPPSHRPRKIRIEGPLPVEVRAVLAQRIFVEKAGLSSSLLNQIKRLAAFQNPEFYKKRAMRLSTATTPRIITCAEDLPEHVALPRGCLNDLRCLFKENAVILQVEDKRHNGDSLLLKFSGTLTAVQEDAAKAILAEDLGVMVAPPGVGKTVVGIYVAAARGVSTLVLVHRKPLLDQWVSQLSVFLGIPRKEIGQIGGGKQTATGRLDVAMIQSLVRKGNVSDLVARYGYVVIDECHHIPAVSFERVLSEAKARYVTGLTATPYRRDGHQPIIEMHCGSTRFSITSKSQTARRPFDHRLFVRETGFTLADPQKKMPIQEVYAALAADERRNELILKDVIDALVGGRSPIVLTERKDHLEYLAARLHSFTKHLIVLRGGMGAKGRREAFEQLARVPEGEERLVLATGRYIGEGFDDARLDALFLALPISWKGTLVQYTGRLHRLHPGKSDVRIYDYVDRQVPMLARMFDRRRNGYRSIGYREEALPPPQSQGLAEVVIEYDEEAVRSAGELF
jgi:superfamily II DNA or RNA helicase